MSHPVLVRSGLATPLGLSSAATTHALAARVACFRDTEVQCRDGEPMRAAWFRSLNTTLSRAERMAFFGARALGECLADLPKGAFQKVPVFLALPEPNRGAPVLPVDILGPLRRVAPPGVTLDFGGVGFLTGRAGFFQALEAAIKALNARTTEVAVVGGVDSFCDKESLAALDDADRNLCDVNPDGLIPGEGAGTLLLMDSVAAR